MKKIKNRIFPAPSVRPGIFLIPLALILLLFTGCRSSTDSFSIRVEEAVPVPNNQGDTWIAGFANGDTIYSPSNDTKGFYRFFQTFNSNIAFNKIIIDRNTLSVQQGYTVNPMEAYGSENFEGPDGCTWKSSGCNAVDGVLYWVIARHTYGENSGDPDYRQTAVNASIIKSVDLGVTWTPSAQENYDRPMFPGSQFSTPYFVQYGTGSPEGIDNSDKYVYAVSNNGFWDNGDHLILGRVLRSQLKNLNPDDWQFYTGGDGMLQENWSANRMDAALILSNPGKLGMSGMVYNPELRKYFYIGWYYPEGGGKKPQASRRTVWDFYEADKPWGSWHHFASHSFEPEGYYTPQICPDLISANGKKMVVFTAGDWNNDLFYRLTLVPVGLADR